MTTKKSKSKNDAKKKPAAKKLENVMFDEVLASFRAATASANANPIDKRKELLAQVAGSIAGGMVQAPTPSISTPSSMATAAVDIAEEILLKAGIFATEPVVESSGEAQVGTAS